MTRPKDLPENADPWFAGTLNEDDPDPEDAGDLLESIIENNGFDYEDDWSDRNYTSASPNDWIPSPNLGIRNYMIMEVVFIWRKKRYSFRISHGNDGWRESNSRPYFVPRSYPYRSSCFGAIVLATVFESISGDDDVRWPIGLYAYSNSRAGLLLRPKGKPRHSSEVPVGTYRILVIDLLHRGLPGLVWKSHIFSIDEQTQMEYEWSPDCMAGIDRGFNSWESCLVAAVEYLIERIETGFIILDR